MNKPINKTWLGLLCLLLPMGCAAQARDWKFVQEVGGMAVSPKPLPVKGRLILPVRVNVSGTEKITIKPTMLHSGLVCEGITVTRKGNEIGLTIRTTLPLQGLRVECPNADLGELPAGDYKIVYLSPNGDKQPLSSFTYVGP